MESNPQPIKGYISRQLFRVATAYLDSQGMMTKIVKTKRVKCYFIYMNGKIYGGKKKTSHTRQAAVRKIYKLYLLIKQNQ